MFILESILALRYSSLHYIQYLSRHGVTNLTTPRTSRPSRNPPHRNFLYTPGHANDVLASSSLLRTKVQKHWTVTLNKRGGLRRCLLSEHLPSSTRLKRRSKAHDRMESKGRILEGRNKNKCRHKITPIVDKRKWQIKRSRWRCEKVAMFSK